MIKKYIFINKTKIMNNSNNSNNSKNKLTKKNNQTKSNDKKYQNSLKQIIDKNFVNDNMFYEINENRKKQNQKEISLNKYSQIINMLKKLFLQAEITTGDICNSLVNNYDNIIKIIKKEDIKKQKRMINDIILILNNCNSNIKLKDMLKYKMNLTEL